MPALPAVVSLEAFERTPDDPSGCRTELVRGRLVREPPAGFKHGSLAMGIGARLHRFVQQHRLGIVVTAETGFVGSARLAPDLAVEVISPTNSAAEIGAKVRAYLAG